MDKNISIIRRKPRQLRGTPSNKYSIYLSLGIIGISVLSGFGIYYSKVGQVINEKIDSGAYDRTEDEIRRMIELRPRGADLKALYAEMLLLKARNYVKQKEETASKTS